MKTIKYTGNRRKGTLTPRRVWSPQESRQVTDEAAESLLHDTEFKEITQRRRKKRPTQPPHKSEE